MYASAASPFNPDDSNDQLSDKITLLAGQINAAEYRFLKMIAEFDRRIAWEGPGIRSCAYWLNWKCGIDMGAAREKGELSYSKVRAMTRAATEQNESFLLDIAQYGTAQHIEKLIGAFRTVSRIEEFDDSVIVSDQELDQKREQLLYDSRDVCCYQDDDGMWIIKAKLPAEEGALLVKVITELGEKVSAETFSGYKKADLDKESLSKKSDLRDLEAKKLEPKKLESKELETIEEKLTFPQRRADALVAMAEHFIATVAADNKDGLLGSDFSTLKGADRCQLVLHLHHGIGNKSDSALSPNLEGQWLLPDAARRLACDASLLVVDQDSVGNVLDIGRKSRVIPVAMARALSIRDGGCCQFPGCCNTRYVEGHHIKHWADGGETKLDNLVSLCRLFSNKRITVNCIRGGILFLLIRCLFIRRLNGLSALLIACVSLR